MISQSQSVPLRRYRAQRWETVAAEAVVEAPVSLTVNGVHWVTFMCTPVELDALAAGFLFNEGIIDAAGDIVDVHVCANGTNVDVWLSHAVSRPPIWRRTSGCMGGVTRADRKRVCPLSEMPNGPVLPARAVGDLMAALQGAQQLYRSAGGVHASALSNGQDIGLLAEDIGRHNTMDKLAGRCLLDRRVMSASILLTTGRFSSEMVEKAARMETPILISRTAPSTLAIELAKRFGLTLIGYARRDSFNVYAHGWRLADWPPQAEDEETTNAEPLQLAAI
jgi:FdhD protein